MKNIPRNTQSALELVPVAFSGASLMVDVNYD